MDFLARTISYVNEFQYRQAQALTRFEKKYVVPKIPKKGNLLSAFLSTVPMKWNTTVFLDI